MKKFLSLLLILMLILCFAACGSDEPDTPDTDDPVQQDQQEDPVQQEDPADDQQQEEDLPPELKGWLKIRTGRFYSQFAGEMYIEYELEYEGQVMKMISATKGDKTYSETSIDGVSAGVSIIDGNDMYTIDHASKMVVKMALQPQGTESVVSEILTEEDLALDELKEGTREVDGKKYDTEEWVIEGAASIMCFDGDDLAYIIGVFDGEETVMKVTETSDKVDDKLFEIPEDYQVMEF